MLSCFNRSQKYLITYFSQIIKLIYKMKFTLAFLSAAFAFASAREVNEIKADSSFGQKIMSKARRVEEEVDYTWVQNMSIKFVGCHHISQWNPDADGEDDVRIETKRLALFRLCPASSCSTNALKGCSSGYGDYIVDMDEFLAAYIENKEEVEEYNCEYAAENSCNCDDGDDKDDGFDADACEQNCYSNLGMDYCIEKKYYDAYGEQYEKFDASEYTECAQYEGANNNRRRLDGGDDAAEVEYFVGAYCGNDGATINLGMFTDDACTEFVDDNTSGRSTFYSMAGEDLPYGKSSMVSTECISCQDVEPDQYYPEANEFCQASYAAAGKCESSISTDIFTGTINENACGFMAAVKQTSANGVINSGNTGGNSVASAFISIFGIAFVLLGSYVYYLKTKLDRGRINLSD